MGLNSLLQCFHMEPPCWGAPKGCFSSSKFCPCSAGFPSPDGSRSGSSAWIPCKLGPCGWEGMICSTKSPEMRPGQLLELGRNHSEWPTQKRGKNQKGGCTDVWLGSSLPFTKPGFDSGSIDVGFAQHVRQPVSIWKGTRRLAKFFVKNQGTLRLFPHGTC